METSESHQISHQEMRKYAGQYVAVTDGKIVASGKNLYKKVQELEKKHPDNQSNIHPHRRPTHSLNKNAVTSPE